jgi:hypothetical protein
MPVELPIEGVVVYDGVRERSAPAEGRVLSLFDVSGPWFENDGKSAYRG